MSCFLFGHAHNAETLRADVMTDGFLCRRCGRRALWLDQHRDVRRMVERTRNALATEAGRGKGER
jgi:hypothetical protein